MQYKISITDASKIVVLSWGIIIIIIIIIIIY
jgi:hypothetical protein